MGAFSNYLETELLDHTLGENSRSWASPGALYVGLCTGSMADDANVGECDQGTYARKAISFDAASGSSAISTTDTITFDQATGTSWGVIKGYGIYDATTTGAGNLLYYASLSSNVTVNVNDTVEFAGAAIVVTLD